VNLRLALAAALAGSAIGAAVVLADDDRAPNVPAVAPAKTVPRDKRPPVQARDVTIAVRADDPEGGPPWAVRRFTSNAAESECAELGRIVDGAFGWIDGHGTFRPARAGLHQAPDLCYQPDLLAKIGAQTVGTTTVAYPPPGSPRPSRGITWGVAGPEIRAIRPEGGPEIAVTKRGAFLAVSDTPPKTYPKGELIRRDGSVRRYDYGPEYPKTFIAPKPGTTRVAVKAPDPAGGQPWAILVADGPHGEWCQSQPGRELGLRLGEIDSLDTFRPLFDMIVCRPPSFRVPTPAYPLRLTSGLWGEEPGDDTIGHVERRVLQGRTTISGQVDASVASVTLKTPRDVRTLVPSQPDHLILAVYEGSFPTGNVTAIAHMNDGRDVTRSVYVG
jgi:hypothetical protein